MSQKVCFFHTVASLAQKFEELADEYLSEIKFFHIVDESLIQELISVGKLTPSINNRLCCQLSLAQRAGAGIVLDTCSSTSPGVNVARELVDIPIMKVDDPMAEKAVSLGRNIGVVASARSTLGPSTELISSKAEDNDREIRVNSVLIEEAFSALQRGNMEVHDDLVSKNVLDLAEDNDVVVLAQASMSHLVDQLQNRVSVPILTSPELAVETLAERLKDMD